ncbi:SusC/RagA family TonB-linked outer membrane protein [Sunxiuqinia elliptica]|uniref:TonB-linked SusC/RagA family outer membrane protein n=1 Tax=Sunxiuqinia elliptica TaxID=655355 RepID=A0A4R6HAM1_9BACT|nr:TonB-dependent receptor [Sunxiuqinia elliptica]TDO05410.1 TonB-linked SusC/RagA family outer membrane protein [Sunxiuqinia elliptica]TDO64957.1 TonB-linked SusC/RagA family outer membrane protein [Sunxiuqinia elliptica]
MKKKDPKLAKDMPSRLILLMLFIFCISVNGVAKDAIVPAGSNQSQLIKGQVFDKEGSPLPGVTVVVKGTTQGTVTDFSGQYSISVQGTDAVLVYSFVGMTTEEVLTNGRTTINVTLKEDIKSVDEVVVVGYGTLRKMDLTGSVESVRMNEMQKAPVKSFDESLAGRIAGVTVAGNDGQPGTNNNIVIRGVGSITGSTSPLYVIDGAPMEDSYANTLNPSDIESINILKDASATAIYGARGANGVVLITTKRGTKGAPVVTYNAYFGFSVPPKPLDLMGAYEFVKYQAELNPNYAQNVYFINGKTLDDYKDAKSIDLQDQMFQSSPVHNHEISVRGGSENTSYSASGNVLDQDGIAINSGFKRYQGRITLDQQFNKKLKIGIDATYSSEISHGAILTQSSDSYTYANLSLLYSVWGFRPVLGDNENLLDELFDPAMPSTDFRVNPILSAENELRRTKVDNLRANGYLEYKLTPHLTLKFAGGLTNIMVERQGFFNSLTTAGNERRDQKQNGFIYFRPVSNWNNTNTLTYNRNFDKVHNLNVVVGNVIQKQKDGNYGFSAIQVLNEGTGVDGLDEASANFGTSGSSRWSLASFLGRINYSYRSKYILTASARYDGSSKFAPGNRWGFFPSGAIAWRMSEEGFLKEVDFLSNAKLRVSHGATGNNRISDFAYLSTMAIPRNGGYSFNNGEPTRGALLENFGNPRLKWETTYQTNIGYDLGLFESRIDLSADLYRKTTEDVLLNANLPYSTGLTTIYNVATAYKNIGKIRNQGVEFTINTINIQKKNFEWSTNFNISFNQNKVMELNEGQSALLQNVNFDTDFRNTTPYIAQLDKPIGQMYGLIWDGVYQYEDFDLVLGDYILKSNVPTNGQARANVQPGDIKYKDINGDLVVNEMDFSVIGRGYPIHTGGFSNTFRYKGFDLNIFFQWSYGNDLINANRLFFEGNAKRVVALNQFATYQNRWTPENPSNEYFRTAGKRDTYYTSREVEDGSFLRLKTVSLGYDFQQTLVDKLKLKSLRIYASAQNLYTWTGYSGQNPDVSTRHSALTPGFDFAAYPLATTLTFGIKASF